MNSNPTEELTILQTLYSEHDYTIQVLDEIVSRQDHQIRLLLADVAMLKNQILSLKTQMPDEINSIDELPPHY